MVENIHESNESMKLSSLAEKSSSFSAGSSGSCGMGNLLAEPRISLCSQIDEAAFDVSDELALENLECPRNEKVGVGGPDKSDALDKEPPEECAQTVVLTVRSSLDCDAPLRSATSLGRLSGLRSRIVEIMDQLSGSCAAWIPSLYVGGRGRVVAHECACRTQRSCDRLEEVPLVYPG